jgi:hypothetical protein
VVLGRTSRERSAKIHGNVACSAARRDRIPEKTSAEFPRAVRGVDDAFRFDPLEGLKQFRASMYAIGRFPR